MATSPAERGKSARSVVGRVLRTLFWALFFAFLFGFFVGTVLRREMEQPIRYIGAIESRVREAGLELSFESSASAARPGNVRHAPSRILVSRDHEEQIG